MQYHLLTIAQKFEICYSTIGCYETKAIFALVEREIAELSSMIPMFTLCFIAVVELPKAKNLQLQFQRDMHEVQMRWTSCNVDESSREASTLYYWDIKYI